MRQSHDVTWPFVAARQTGVPIQTQMSATFLPPRMIFFHHQHYLHSCRYHDLLIVFPDLASAFISLFSFVTNILTILVSVSVVFDSTPDPLLLLPSFQ